MMSYVMYSIGISVNWDLTNRDPVRAGHLHPSLQYAHSNCVAMARAT